MGGEDQIRILIFLPEEVPVLMIRNPFRLT
jgi:hypothetical protein